MTIRNEWLNYLVKLLEGDEKSILIPNSCKVLSNKILAAIVRNPTKNVDYHLDTIQPNVQQHSHKHWTGCCYYYCKSHGSGNQIRGRYLKLENTTCTICEQKVHGYLSCYQIRPVLLREQKLQEY